MQKKGFFLTLEGTDGTGKSTQARLLKSWIEKTINRKVLLTHEPGGGGPAAQSIRKFLLNPRTRVENLTELLLYQAARVEHVTKVIRPALQKGTVVICDRFTDATLAYQGAARGLPTSKIIFLNQLATGGLKPDLTIWLDLPTPEGLRRAKARHSRGKGDRLENEGAAFQNKVRNGYRNLARKESGRIKKIAVQPTIEATQKLIRALLTKTLTR